MNSYVSAPRKVRASQTNLPAGPVGVMLGNTTRIDPGMRNVTHHADITGDTDTMQSKAPYSAHTASGEDASRSTSTHWALTQESLSPYRATFDAYRMSHPHLTYVQARAALQALQDEAFRQDVERRSIELARLSRSHRSRGTRRNAVRRAKWAADLLPDLQKRDA